MRRLVLLLLFAASACAPAQWQLQDSHSTASLRGIHSLANGVAWASGANGTILHTVDKGEHWLTCTIPPGAEKLDFRGVQAFDASTAIVMSSGKGDLSRLYKTTDACVTWKLVFTNPDKEGFWDALKFRSRTLGVLLGDPVGGVFTVLLTFNGGQTWERQTLLQTRDNNGEGAFAASNSSIIMSESGRAFGTGGLGGPRIISIGSGPSDVFEGDVSKTKHLPWETDQSAAELPATAHCEACGVFSLATDLSGTIVAVGGDYTRPSERADTAWTNIFMNSSDLKLMFGFKASTTPPHGYRSAVAYSPTTKSWITVGPNGTDISTDDGRNWHPLLPSPADAPDADKEWNALSLPFVVGSHGRIGLLRPDALK